MKINLTIIFIGILTASNAQQINYTYNGSNGAGGLTNYGIVTQASGGQATLGAEGIGDLYANLNLGSNISGTRRFWHISKRTSSDNHSLQFYFYDGSSFNSPGLTLASNGNAGIGATNPMAKLHVANGQIMASDPTFPDINVRIDGTSIPVIRFTRWTGVASDYHNAFVGQFWNAALGCYSLGIGTGVSTTGDVNATTNAISIPTNGNVGIGTTSPEQRLDVRGNFVLESGTNPVFYTGTGSVELNRFLQLINSTGYGSASGLKAGGVLVADSYAYANPGKNDLVVKGNVGIGTPSPDAKLAVKGQIHAQEVKVDVNGSVAPDYVFSKDYQLPSLEAVRTYIEKNKHLPEVPSAEDMEKDGLKLGEMNLLLLKKIEELTLYILQQQGQIESQQAAIRVLEAKMK